MDYNVINPATEELITQVMHLDARETDEAVARAQRAWEKWRTVSASDRTRILRRFARAVQEAADHLAELETQNAGHPITNSRGTLEMIGEVMEYYAAAPQRIIGQQIPVDGGIDVTFHEPMGVVAVIAPWNFPLTVAVWGMMPALAAGNTVILKPSELTPLTTIRLCALAAEAGLPDDVVQVVTGAGSVVGQALLDHPGVAKIIFTGSTAVGRNVMAAAAPHLKRVTLELGGKSPNIIFGDADLEAAAFAAPMGAFYNTGQDCCARTRLLVQHTILDKFIDLLIPATNAIVVGDPQSPSTQVGPLISAAHRDRVASFITDREEVIVQGGVPEGPGFYFPASVLFSERGDAPSVSSEIFGPVVTLTPFKDEADAIRIANDTTFGLAGSIWSRDIGRALRTARGIQAGNLSINNNSAVRYQTPFGGFKHSGIGRELGPDAPLEFTEKKNVFIATD